MADMSLISQSFAADQQYCLNFTFRIVSRAQLPPMLVVTILSFAFEKKLWFFINRTNTVPERG
jgi:hypothetical protein